MVSYATLWRLALELVATRDPGTAARVAAHDASDADLARVAEVAARIAADLGWEAVDADFLEAR
ncbi:MAG TPA: hypothetical protein VGG33_17380 [Polyangia bacterium]